MSVLTPLGFSLLRQLSDGAFHSGEDLAATVGLTRARVSQLLKQAETAGLSLERVRGLGYRLTATPDFLDADEVRRALARPRDQGQRTSRRSTSRWSTRSARPPPSSCAARQRRDIHGAVLAAEWQSAGRGRRGKAWTAVAGGSLTFSLGWRYEQGAGFLAGLSLAVGVAVVKRAGSRRPGRRRAQVAERPRLPAPQGGRHPGRAQRRRARPVDGRRRRRPQRALPRRSPPQHRAAGERPHDGRRPRRAGDRPQSPARARSRPSSRRRSTRTRTRASRRSPPSGSTATPTRASR